MSNSRPSFTRRRTSLQTEMQLAKLIATGFMRMIHLTGKTGLAPSTAKPVPYKNSIAYLGSTANDKFLVQTAEISRRSFIAGSIS